MIALLRCAAVTRRGYFVAVPRRTRKVLRKFSMVDAITELGTEPAYGIGLELDRVQLLELPKMDFAARPGSHGTYSEAILFFRKPMRKSQ